MKNRLLSILLIVCLCAALLPTFAAAEGEWTEGLWICGVQITSENASSITGEGISGTVSYDRVKHTLTLNNATLTTTETNAIQISNSVFKKFPSRLKINLIGINKIHVENTDAAIFSSSGSGFEGLTLSGSGSLEINCVGYDVLYSVSGIRLYSSAYGAPNDKEPALMIDGVSLEITTDTTESKDRFGVQTTASTLVGTMEPISASKTAHRSL